MYKLVVSDFFGTLINSEEAISLSTMIELDRIRNNGILFCITTSKSARIVIDYDKDFPFIDYVVAFNGSYVFDLINNKVLYDKSLGISIVKKIYKIFKNNDLCFYTLNNCNYTGNYYDKDFSKKINNIDDFFLEYKKGIYKIKVVFDTNKECMKAVKKLKEIELNIDIYSKEENDKFIIEITNSICSKLSGVEVICKKKKISLEEVLAICSSVSSLDLVKKVGYGCSVSNGFDKLKKYSKKITSSNEENGVEKIIKEMFIKKNDCL